MLKVSPDIEEDHISEIVDVVKKNNISGIILTNTTNGNRENLVSDLKKEEGGLSGAPLQEISTNMIKKFYKQLNGKIPIIQVNLHMKKLLPVHHYCNFILALFIEVHQQQKTLKVN